jgi:CHAT domain-containing protein
VAEALKPFRGYGDPVLGRTPPRTTLVASRGYESFFRGASADLASLSAALAPLPETADEVRTVARSLGAADADVRLEASATETDVKRAPLSDYRVVYFATHGLVAGEVEAATKNRAEPALVLSLPDRPSDDDDGLLTASEIAGLKLNADWVVLSACNTAAGDKPGAEALSGLARAFFYAGARSLLVSHWPVESKSAVSLMTQVFSRVEGGADSADALRGAMLAVMSDPAHPAWAEPAYWAPFILVGDPAGAARR